MSAPVPIPFWTQSYEARSRTVTSERLVNWYLEKNPDNAKFPLALYATPGLKLLTTVGAGPIRGLCRMGTDLYVVSGTKLYQVTSALIITEIGDILGNGNVFMVTNEEQILIVTQQQWAYSATATAIVQIAQEYMVGATYQDGYGIAGKRSTEQFFISGLVDSGGGFTSWDATDFTSADAIADPIVGIISIHRQLMVLGRETIEWWSNVGAADFPFARIPGGFAEIGCRASGSVAKAENTVYWLGHDHQVYRAAGFQTQVISTPAISRKIEQQGSPDTAWSFVYAQDGHTFYVLSFDDITMVFDTNTGLWHYRESRDCDRWRANCHAFVWAKNVVGDYSNGKIYELDLDTFTDDTDFIRREADSAPIHARGDLAVMHEFFVDMETGVGLDGEVQGSDPELMISWSDDGGRTWSYEIMVKIGKIGEYLTQARIWGLGQFRQRSIRIAISDPIPANIYGAWANMEATPT